MFTRIQLNLRIGAIRQAPRGEGDRYHVSEMRILPFALLVMIAIFAAACGDDDGSPTPSPARLPTVTLPPTLKPPVTPTPIPSPGVELPSVPAELAAQYRLIFYRDPVQRYPVVGQLWTANLDGSDAEPLTQEGRNLVFAGMPDRQTLYAVEITGELTRSLVRIELLTGASTELATFDGTYEWATYAEMSPDGRWVAYGGGDSTYLWDVATGEASVLMQGNHASCVVVAGCSVYRNMSWSPDGRLLGISKVYYEGGNVVVVDPLVPGVEAVVGWGQMSGAIGLDWSPDSDALCTRGQYDTPSGLYIAHAPDWEHPQPYFSDIEDTYEGGSTVSDCAWLSPSLVVVALTGWDTESLQIQTLDILTGVVMDVMQNEKTGRVGQFLPLPGGDWLIMDSFGGDRSGLVDGYPALLQVSTGNAYAALTRSDIVVAVQAAD